MSTNNFILADRLASRIAADVKANGVTDSFINRITPLIREYIDEASKPQHDFKIEAQKGYMLEGLADGLRFRDVVSVTVDNGVTTLLYHDNIRRVFWRGINWIRETKIPDNEQ
ncbi:MAG: hypothetical protein EKK63_15715 [Acinetobacter sp.]|uniref:hypothetical protein n=1 Tax=Acinetobacter sp. TaxID=472 RepID=UPI000F9425D4|nr:hypothetical protein [Acinetobacter sp.]RUP37016.1 MAG: hypothetical protein EKK63_15715 [Acinetobacter sp.]